MIENSTVRKTAELIEKLVEKWLMPS